MRTLPASAAALPAPEPVAAAGQVNVGRALLA